MWRIMTDVYFLFFFDVMIGYRATEIPLVHSSKHIFSLLLIENLNLLISIFLRLGHFVYEVNCHSS